MAHKSGKRDYPSKPGHKKLPKGYHKMPDGRIMKDSDMKPKR